MTYLILLPVLVTAVPAVILGIACLVHTMEASIREEIGR
jgi:hypothetical protein